MAKGDIMPLENSNASKMPGSLKYYVASGALASINAGEPVQKAAGVAAVAAAQTNFPTTTLRVVGVASSNSTDTVAASGTVDVIPATNGQIWLIKPKVAATWTPQATYNALIGARVLIDLTSSTYTILASDGASNGCIIEYLDLSRYPGMVAFSFSPLCDYRNV